MNFMGGGGVNVFVIAEKQHLHVQKVIITSSNIII